MLLHIQGHRLPGRVWQVGDEHHDNIHVGIQLGKEPHQLVRSDAQKCEWTIPIEVVAGDGGLDFRGLAVQGNAANGSSTSPGVTSETMGRSRCSAGPSSCSPTS